MQINYLCKIRNWAQGYSHKNAGRSISTVFIAGIALSMSSAEKGMLHKKLKVKLRGPKQMEFPIYYRSYGNILPQEMSKESEIYILK